MSETWEQTGYMVACPRKDGSAPDPVKAVHDTFAWCEEDAFAMLREVERRLPELKGTYKVFQVVVSVPRNQVGRAPDRTPE